MNLSFNAFPSLIKKIYIYSTFHSFLERFALIYAINIPIMKNAGLSSSDISLVFGLHELSRMFTSGYSSFLGELLGSVPPMLIGLLLKTIAVLFWISDPLFTYYLYNIFIGGIILGCGNGFTMSKMNPEIYNLLERKEKISLFSNIMFVKNLARQIGATISGVAVSYLLFIFSYKGIVLITIFLIFIPDAILLIFWRREVKKEYLSDNQDIALKGQQSNIKNIDFQTKCNSIDKHSQRCSIVSMIRESRDIFKRKKYIFPAILYTGTITSVFYLISDLTKAIYVYNGGIGKYYNIYSLIHLLPMLTSVLMIFFIKQRNNSTKPLFMVKEIIFISTIFIIMFGFFALVEFKYFIILPILYATIFPILKVYSIEFLNYSSEKNFRFISSGLSNAVTSIVDVLGFFVFGLLGRYITQGNAAFFAMCFLSVIILSPLFSVSFRKYINSL